MDAVTLEALFQTSKITVHQRLDVGIETGDERTLVFADLRPNRRRRRHRKTGLARQPFREIEFDILYGQGICRSADLLDLESEAGVVEKSGAWFSFQGERIGQGRDNARLYLEQHPELLEKVERLLLAKHGVKRPGAPAEPEAAADKDKDKNAKPGARPTPKAPAN